MRSLAAFSALSLLVVSCGSGSSGAAAPTPASRSVTFVTYLDENRNGTLDASERIRIPGAEVTLGGASGKASAPSGEGSVTVPQTSLPLMVTQSSLPPFYQAPASTTVTPPTSGTLNVPVNLPTGALATPGVFLAFGDSITNGQVGTGDGQGYTGTLEKMLAAHFGTAHVINDGLDSSNTERGESRIADSLAGGKPAFTLILYGINDWADSRCTNSPPCFTISNLRSMVRKVKAQGGFAFVGTMLMTNVGNDFRASPQRNDWVVEQNEAIRQMAAEEGAVLVDLHRAFETSPLQYSQLFADYIHPSAEGYKILAQTWFDAITKPRS